MNQVLELSFTVAGKEPNTASHITMIKVKNPDIMIDRDAVYQAMVKLSAVKFLMNVKGDPIQLGTPYLAQLATINKKTIFEMADKVA